jgi:sugar phosphate permease
MTSEASAVELDAVYRKIAIRIVPFLILGYIMAYLDRSNIGFARVDMIGDLGFSELIFGVGAGLFYLGYSAFEVPSNLMMKKIGARLTFARIMILWGLISASFALVTTATQFNILRFLLGAAEAGFFPGVLLYITFWIPSRRRARITAMFMSAIVLSGLIGGPISGLIMGNMEGVAGLRGWQWLFIIEGLPSCFLGVFALFWMADSPSSAKWLSEKEKQMVLQDIALDESNRKNSGIKMNYSLRDAFRDKRIYILGFMSIALISGIGGLSFWLPQILRNSGIENIVTLGYLSAIPYFFALIVQQWVAYNSDRVQERRLHVSICALVCGVSWILLPSFADQTWTALLLVTFACAGAFGATGPFWAMPSAFLSGTAAAGGIAIVTTFGGISGFISPIVVGWATDMTSSLSAGQYYYGTLYLIGACAIFFGTESYKKRSPL